MTKSNSDQAIPDLQHEAAPRQSGTLRQGISRALRSFPSQLRVSPSLRCSLYLPILFLLFLQVSCFSESNFLLGPLSRILWELGRPVPPRELLRVHPHKYINLSWTRSVTINSKIIPTLMAQPLFHRQLIP